MTTQTVSTNFRARSTRLLHTQSDQQAVSQTGLRSACIRTQRRSDRDWTRQSQRAQTGLGIEPATSRKGYYKSPLLIWWLSRRGQWSFCVSACLCVRSEAFKSLWRWTKPSRTSCSTMWVLPVLLVLLLLVLLMLLLLAPMLLPA